MIPKKCINSDLEAEVVYEIYVRLFKEDIITILVGPGNGFDLHGREHGLNNAIKKGMIDLFLGYVLVTLRK